MTSPRQPGFTLIELMITLAIMAVLATAVLPLAEISVQRTKEQELRHALHEIRSAIDAYKKATDDGHVARSGFGSGYPKDLRTLAHGVIDAKSPTGAKLYFLRQVPRDPFFPKSTVDAEQTWDERAYASEPDAPRLGEDVYDIHSRSDQIGLNGVPYRQW